MHFLPQQKHTLQEKHDLDEKIAGLHHFVKGRNFETIPKEERLLRLKQLKSMIEYRDILEELVKFWRGQ